MFVTALAVWLTLEFTRGFPSWDKCKALWKEKSDPQEEEEEKVKAEEAEKEEAEEAGKVKAEEDAKTVAAHGVRDKVASTPKVQTSREGGNQLNKKRLGIWPRKPQRAHVESGLQGPGIMN